MLKINTFLLHILFMIISSWNDTLAALLRFYVPILFFSNFLICYVYIHLKEWYFCNLISMFSVVVVMRISFKFHPSILAKRRGQFDVPWIWILADSDSWWRDKHRAAFSWHWNWNTWPWIYCGAKWIYWLFSWILSCTIKRLLRGNRRHFKISVINQNHCINKLEQL